MEETLAVTFSFSGINKETGNRLINHQETHHVPFFGFSPDSFLKKIDLMFPDNLWKDKKLKIIENSQKLP